MEIVQAELVPQPSNLRRVAGQDRGENDVLPSSQRLPHLDQVPPAGQSEQMACEDEVDAPPAEVLEIDRYPVGVVKREAGRGLADHRIHGPTSGR